MSQTHLTAFTNVTVIPMTGGEPALHEQTVLIENERIKAVGPAAAIRVPESARHIDGTGKSLVPGLCDMHVHLAPTGLEKSDRALSEEEALRRARQFLVVFLASGITTVRNMAGTPRHLKLREEVARGTTPGPRIFSTGPVLESRYTFAQLEVFGQLVRSVAEARAVVLSHKRAGYDFIKVYNDIDAEIYDEIVRTAREVGMPVVGHVAFSKGLDGALKARQDSIEHLRSYDFAVDTRADAGHERFVGWLHTSPQRIAEIAERTAAAGVWNVPTLVVEHNLHTDEELAQGASRGEPAPHWLPAWLRESIDGSSLDSIFTASQRSAMKAGMSARMEMVGALDHAGAPLMVGTDCPVCQLVPGRSLLQELELYVQAGLTPLRALQAATISAARFLGVEAEQGSIVPGKRADLLLLDANPLEDIRAVYRQAGVCVRGNWLTSADVRALLGKV